MHREPDPADRRGSFSVSTDKGVAMRERMWAVYARGIAEPFDEHLNDEEAKTLSGVNVGGRRNTRNVRTRNLYAKP